MKKIGVLLSASPGGGAFQYTQAMLNAVLAFPPGFSITAAVGDPLWLDVLPERVKIVRIVDTPFTRALNKLWHLSRLPQSLWRHTAAKLDTNVRTLQAAGCELWICPNHDRFVFRAPVPTLGTVHDLMHRYEPQFPEVSDNGEFEAREFHFGETSRWARGVLVDSEVGRMQLMESYGVPAGRVFVLPYIPPAYVYTSDPSRDSEIIERYKLPKKFFFYPAQFYRHKNHVALIDALARLKAAHPDAHLVLVGTTERNGFADVQAQVRRLGLEDNVQFLGYVPDNEMPALYRAARALVMPTYFGPTNIPQLEAFALGCPVATSRIYGIPDQVGDAALLFDPKSVDEILSCLRRLWEDDALCSLLVEKGKQHASAWGPSQFRDRLVTIVEELTA
ncbi:MAG TPA: glycosyltransferase family 1 protein [Gemmatimonadaceae bacterium]|nr:glycosyltransferase family 1 protein [Gemmatimonadaceae bacterium]